MQEMKTEPSLKPSLESEAYDIRRADQYFARLIPPRRMPFPTFSPIWEGSVKAASLTHDETYALTDDMLHFAGLDDYVGSSTFETAHPTRKGWAHRPITHYAHISEQQNLIDAYLASAAEMYKIILGNLEPCIQVYDKNSRVGAPIYKVLEHKLEALMPFFETLLTGDLSLFDRPDVYTINNVRQQAEPKTKIREYIYVGPGGKPYLKKIGWADRFDDEFKRHCSRLRLVFNYPLPNLLIQVVDTAIHKFFLRYPACSHNMAARIGRPLPGFVLAMDVKHFERAIGCIMRHRHKFLGGLYAEITQRLLATPYLVPGDDGDVYAARIRNDKGFVEQLGSGISAVAPVAKEVLMMLYALYLCKYQGLRFKEAFFTALGGGTEKLQIMNYGDDNLLFGDEDEVLRCFEFMKTFLTVEKEDPPKFLGHLYSPQDGFFLGRKSYVSNLYLAERGPKTRFRPYPFLGYTLRRHIFAEQGEAFIRNEIFDYEDRRLAERGYTPERIAEAAAQERQRVSAGSLDIAENRILEKEYLLSDEQKAQDVNYDILGKGITQKWIERLLR